MTPRRRKAVSLAVLAPTALIALGYGLSWSGPFMLAGVVGGAAMLATAWLLVSAVLPGVDAQRGVGAVFVAGWGAVVLSAAVGAAGAAVTSDELLQRSVGPDSSAASGVYYGWYHYGESVDDPEAVGSQTAVSMSVGPSAAPSVGPLGGSVVPEGTAAGALLAGWLAGGAGAFAYARTRPAAEAPPDALPDTVALGGGPNGAAAGSGDARADSGAADDGAWYPQDGGADGDTDGRGGSS
ncbi:hypothetical protein [Streptomonospora wellingtoniae]|uniref:Uncharacterized protein n=1 Tax=Streptomonospora wellingtoniae TaxID=3075544 RepID=A0ABU2KTG3_9ACTN|nr:hypothetical protein [Streptomonospora sp. DSM 45055]MDT0302559.1 hypothetical protein [Streptomonospora sp. DSM 45055]